MGPREGGRETVDIRQLRDDELLREYFLRGNQDAFKEIVRRYTPLVESACRRMLRRGPGIADDAVQATWLLLARRGRSLMTRESISGWLHRVACFVCRSGLRDEARRKKHEERASAAATPGRAESAWEDIEPVLDQELHALPRKYHEVLVLHHLQQKPLEEVATLLGRPLGTIATWVRRGGEALRDRLVRRGLTVSGGALAALIAAHVASPATAT